MGGRRGREGTGGGGIVCCSVFDVTPLDKASSPPWGMECFCHGSDCGMVGVWGSTDGAVTLCVSRVKPFIGQAGRRPHEAWGGKGGWALQNVTSVRMFSINWQKYCTGRICLTQYMYT